ncbi:helix-turn-helix domain-containing protein [Streptomyces sp. P38-E01]|uniref:Helix-turn-helix domain-containing protein n=1 Tax=Streptomyces tardus TaxID=2780544 RepID=A0A949JEE7_9ACTN|nr:helix-turn-helix transcriptional regulator [Streptomyces tardus]MBU7598532.1 helix-turn-helix domain-containing protein [Streptomyces tardus]
MTEYRPPTALPGVFLNREDVKIAVAAHDFGTVFRLARSELGISYSKIAAECDIKPERVGLLARGRGNITSFEKVARISDALRIPGRLLGLAARDWETNESSCPASCASPDANTATSEGGTVKRRHFFRATAGAGMAVGFSDLDRIVVGQQIGHSIPSQLRRRTTRLRRLDDVLGGGDTYRIYLGEYQATKRMARECDYSERTGRELLSVLAEQAQQAGWAAFDGGKHADASGLYEESYRAATEAGDKALAGNALAFLAYQKSNGSREAGVEFAIRSCRTAGTGAPRGVRALLHERLAWAHALAGQPRETAEALDAAEAALNDDDGEPQPDWAAWVDQTEIKIMTGRCWAELRRPLRAVPVLEEALREYDDTHARDKSLYLSWLADSYLNAGEIEQSAAVTGRALDLCAGVASVRPRARLAPVLARLGEHRDLSTVADVLERARS